MKVFLDTSVLVAAFVAEHEHHSRAYPIVQSVHDRKTEGFVSGHSILETYSVLTRLPKVPRISASQAATMVSENIVKHFSPIVLTAKEYSDLSARLGAEGVTGGRCYDLLHLTCAEKCGADRIYTFNVGDFAALAGNLRAKIFAP